MSIKNLVVRAGVLIAIAAPGVASAQSVGVLTGHVYDQSGTPIRGVKVTVSSDTQIGGPKSTSTDDQGLFRITSLSPGIFEVTASAQNLKTVIQKNVKVIAAATNEIDILMEVETAEEQVRVVEKAPTVNITNTNVGETFDQEFVTNLPLSTRTYQSVMSLAPGVTDVQGGGNPNSRGGGYFNNNYLVDGVRTTDPVTHTFGTNFSFDAQAQQQVLTAGFGAEHSDTLGAVSNIVTKSGSNRFEAEATATYQDQNMVFFKEANDDVDSRTVVGSLSLGGPIAKDRLWFYFSGQGASQKFTLPYDNNYPRHPGETLYFFDGTAKLTWQLTPRNKVEARFIYSPAEINNQRQSYLVEPEAESRKTQNTRAISLQWNSALSDNLSLRMVGSLTQDFLGVGPQSCVWDPYCESVPGVFDAASGYSRQNYTSQYRRRAHTIELNGAMDWFADSRRFGAQDLQVGFKFYATGVSIADTVPGNAVVVNNGVMPFQLQEACSNDPKNDNGDCHHNWRYSDISGNQSLGWISDAWKVTRYFTIRPELAAHLSQSRNDKGVEVTGLFTVTPHIGFSWNATHDGRTAIRASLHSRVDPGFLDLADLSSRQLFTRLCSWDQTAQAYVRNCRSAGGDAGTTVGLPCGPDGLNPDGTSCRTKLRPPRLWEATIGAEREVWTGISVGADYIYRRFVHQWEDVETNGLWNMGGTDLSREGGTWKTGRSQFVYDLETPDINQRRYHSVTAFLRKREGLLKAFAAYTWTRSRGTTNSTYAGSFLDNPGQAVYFYGPLPDDNRHVLQADVTYQATRALSLGLSYRFISGAPYNHIYYSTAVGAFRDFRSQRGTDSRGTPSPDDDVELRLPDLSLLSAQVRFNLQPFIKQPLDLFADVFNILALRTTTQVFETDGPAWSQRANWLPPMNARIGVHYRFH